MTNDEIKHAFSKYCECKPITNDKIIALYHAAQDAKQLSFAFQGESASIIYFCNYAKIFKRIIRRRGLDAKKDK